MGVSCFEEKKMIIIIYDCIGKGKLEITTCRGSSLEKSLKIYIREKNINIVDIKEVCYNNAPIDTKKSAKQLVIPEKALLTIKLKSNFN